VPSSLRISQITDAGSNPGKTGQVAAGFGVAGAHQHAAGLRAQRENVAGLDDVAGLGIAFDRGLDGDGAVGRRNAGGHACRGFDRHGERGAVRRLVVGDHLLQAELAAARVGQRQADQAAAVLGHEVDRVRGGEFGSHHQVALVFAVFFVDQYDHAAGLEFFDDF